ncbi:MAG: nucleoside diphosphate kinase regulator [Proteobacteria bacterium]|nr:nucleoside diphosphate kinase regulator [Pseudomonadota bacterium]
MTANQTLSPVILTNQDHERLSAFVASRPGPPADSSELLEMGLNRARIVDPTQIPPNVVTMNSRVIVRDEGSGKTQIFTLVYPGEADISVGKLSVLTPAGTALIGLAQGEVATWVTRDGQTKKLTMVEVLYQPEADGRFDL